MKGSMAVRLGMAMASVLLAGTALAQGPGGGMNGGPGFADHRPPMERAFGGDGIRGRWWNNPKVIERLKLTDDQRKAFDNILQEHREKLVDLRGSLEKAELGMEPLIGNDQPNESQILAQIDKVASARAELEKANARYLLAIRSKLTPEQWKMVQALRANHGEQRGGWDRNGQGRGGPGPGGMRHGQMPAPAGGGAGQAPPPGGPQSMLDGGAPPDAPPAPAEGAGAIQ